MFEAVKEVYYFSEGMIYHNTKIISELTMGVVGNILHVSSLMLLSGGGLCFEIDNILGGGAEKKRCLSNNILSRSMWYGLDFASRLVFGTMGCICKYSAYGISKIGKVLLTTNEKVNTWADNNIKNCIDKIDKMSVPNGDNRVIYLRSAMC